MPHFSPARLLVNVLSVPEFVAGCFVEKNNFLFFQQERIYLSSICYQSFWIKSRLCGIRVLEGAARVIRRGCLEFLFKLTCSSDFCRKFPKNTTLPHKDRIKCRHFLLKLHV